MVYFEKEIEFSGNHTGPNKRKKQYLGHFILDRQPAVWFKLTNHKVPARFESQQAPRSFSILVILKYSNKEENIHDKMSVL